MNCIIFLFSVLVGSALLNLAEKTINDLCGLTSEQRKCKHKWNFVGEINDGRYVIYCPKCKYEKRISKIKWKEMNLAKEQLTKELEKSPDKDGYATRICLRNQLIDKLLLELDSNHGNE